jgi:hypothetical protein
MAMRVRKRPLIVLLAVVLLPALTIAAWRYYSRPLPFDSVRWRSGDAIVRYRMKDALRQEYAAGRLATREAVDEVLGPDDDREELPQVRSFTLRSPGMGFPWYVRIVFDEKGKVLSFIVAPQ